MDKPMTGPEALDAAAAAGPDAFARTLNGVIAALEDAARHHRERQAELPRDEHQVTFNGLANGSVEWTCRCGAGEVAVSPAAAEAEADAHTLGAEAADRDQQQCASCGGWVHYASSDGLCDACVFQQGAAR